MPKPASSSRNTRTTILDAAMQLFAEKGFAATTVKDIASAVGIKDASLYSHFTSKQAIFDAIIERALAHLEEALHEKGAAFTEADDTSPYAATRESDLDAIVLASYQPFFDDTELICLRKMLTVNQFESERAGRLYQTIFIEKPLSLQTTIFDRLVRDGSFKQCNTRVAAYEFHGAVFLLLTQNLSWAEAMPRLRAHLRAFERVHRA